MYRNSVIIACLLNMTSQPESIDELAPLPDPRLTHAQRIAPHVIPRLNNKKQRTLGRISLPPPLRTRSSIRRGSDACNTRTQNDVSKTW